MEFEKEYDLICVGGGIMSATLALMIKLVKPEVNILILERLNKVAQESSAAWNNAGTGHSALCELNYTPEKGDTVDCEKAFNICSQFELSKQFWSFLVTENFIDNPKVFINAVPHHSWVTGKDNVTFLKKRFEALKDHFMFQGMEFTDSIEKMKIWFPLIANNRSEDEIMAATRIERGAEMNFGALTEKLFSILETEYNTPVHCNEEVLDIDPDDDVDWSVEVKNTITEKKQFLDAKHVFIGAGGGSLLLLQKVEIEEKDGYGGFPVSGEWLVCKNEALINKHLGKVYSKAGPHDPPMSTPHLDTRFIDGNRQLMFGPFAGFSPKFLKEGSSLDLFKSIKTDNIKPMLSAFWDNLPLTKYLIEQVTASHEDRMNALRKFVKDAKSEDWELLIAGQRVQIIKKDDYEGGKLQFGTEVVKSKNGSITCLLGASPGASTATSVMLEVFEIAFPEIVNSEIGKRKLEKIVPIWKAKINAELFNKSIENSAEALQLNTSIINEI